MASLGKAFVNIHANLKPLKRGLSLAFMAVKKSMSTMARHVKRGAFIIAAAMTGAVVAAAKFQHEMAKVSTMLDKKTMPIMGDFAEGIDKLSVQFGQGTATLSKGLYDILSASIPAADALHVLEVSAKAAIAGVSETGIAADAITTIINSYQMSAADAADISDKLFATIKRGKIEFPQLASRIGMVASSAAIVGMSLEDLLAVISTSTRAGVPYQVVMTSIRSVLNSFIDPSDEAAIAAEKLGITLSSSGMKAEGFLSVVNKLKDASPELLMKIIENRRGFLAMATSLQDVTGITTDYGILTEKFMGMSEEAYIKMSDTARQKFNEMKQSLLSVSRSFGTELLPVVTMVMGRIKQFLITNKEELKYWGEVVAYWLNVFIDWLDYVFYKIDTVGWEDAMTDMMEDVKWAVIDAYDELEEVMIPRLVDMGKTLARALWTAFGQEISTLGIKALDLVVPGDFESKLRQRKTASDIFYEEKGALEKRIHSPAARRLLDVGEVGAIP